MKFPDADGHLVHLPLDTALVSVKILPSTDNRNPANSSLCLLAKFIFCNYRSPKPLAFAGTVQLNSLSYSVINKHKLKQCSMRYFSLPPALLCLVPRAVFGGLGRGVLRKQKHLFHAVCEHLSILLRNSFKQFHRQNPASQPTNNASPKSHLGTISGIFSSQNSWTVAWATQETGTIAVIPDIQKSIPPNSNNHFFCSCCLSPIFKQSNPNPESRRPKSPDPLEKNIKILEILSSGGKARKESKSLHCIPPSSWTTQACQSPIVQISSSFSSKLRFFHWGR
ncbi:hypothetical protein EK904_008588 [Melospiza melodia maxima]|nr:hypothetical protein EK904_008588 [Melospiza melodia maxima]